jgi:multidrug efflux pump subunit AcrA (membrane-fusion protein)
MSGKERGPSQAIDSSSRTGVKVAALALALLPALSLVGCTDGAPEVRATAPAATAIPVVTRAAQIEQMGIEIEAVGTTQANESVDLTSKASNTVTAIRFREGDEVDRGTVLCRDGRRQAEHRSPEAEAALALARTSSTAAAICNRVRRCRSPTSSRSRLTSKPTKPESRLRARGSTTP